MLGTAPGSGRLPPMTVVVLAVLGGGVTGVTAETGELFFTDFTWTEFDDTTVGPFAVGADQWVGIPPPGYGCEVFCGPETWHWCGNSAGDDVHGIDPETIPTLGQTAYLGFKKPCDTFVKVYRRFDHDPAVEGSARIQVDALLGIEDSRNGRHDSFFISFYNIADDFLAALQFVNTPGSTFGIWRDDGMNQFDTGIDFIHGEVAPISIDIDMENNRWKADFLGLPLFVNRTFTATSSNLDLGAIAIEWQIHGDTPADHGDNWLLLADFSVWAIPVGEPNPVIDSVGLDENGYPTFNFTGEPGWNYRVQHADALDGQWLSDLPGSFFNDFKSPQEVPFTDMTARPPAGRYYRIVRTVTP